MIGGNMKGSEDREERPDRSARTLFLHVHKGTSMSLPVHQDIQSKTSAQGMVHESLPNHQLPSQEAPRPS